jgi:hypothetical protein
MPTALLFLLGMGIFAMVVSAMRDTHRVKTLLAKSRARTHLPRVISTLIISVQFSELLKIVTHVSITHVVGALLLLAIVIATKAGTEGELIS